MSLKLLIHDKHKTTATLQSVPEGTTQRITHVRVVNRGAITLGWDRLFAILVQALSGQNPSVWMPRLQQILTALGNIDGVHPDSISREDLNYLVANATAFGTVLARAGNGEIDPAILALLGKYKDLGDPYAPVDDPDPFYVETFFTKATQSISEGTYEGWWSPIEHENLPIGAPGGAGKIELIGVQPDQDKETIVEGKWQGLVWDTG